MFSPKIQWFLYGVLITSSLVSVITYANSDGIFGDYFENIIDDATSCWVNTAITWFDATPWTTYGTQECTTFDTIVRLALWVWTAPSWQAVVWFDLNGDPVYGDVNWHKDGTENISYTGAGNVGIGTDTPASKLEVAGNMTVANGIQIGNYDPSKNINIANMGMSYFNGGNVGIGTIIPMHSLDVNGEIYAKWDICVDDGIHPKVCLEWQKGDPLYLRSVTGYTGIYPSNNLNTGVLWQWIKQEWDEYGRVGCQQYKDLYGTWTAADVATCQAAYPWNGNTLQAIIDNSWPAAVLLNHIQYQIMWGNPWIPHGCQQITIAYICDWQTNCWSYPWRINTVQPDFMQFTCFGI